MYSICVCGVQAFTRQIEGVSDNKVEQEKLVDRLAQNWAKKWALEDMRKIHLFIFFLYY